MRYLSVCSGIEAATVAWHPLGWEPVAFSEIEDFPSAVLEQRHPEVPNVGDMTRYKEWDRERFADLDVLVGGTPCQSFSVAGLRQGMDDPRGNLALVLLGVADRFRPTWVVWENVPGVLSSDGGRDFGAFLGGLGQLGYGWAYRVMDAQYVRVESHPRAVPQRRRRVFVVGCLGGWQRAAAVLLERESLSGHPPPRREAGQGVTPILEAGARTGRSTTDIRAGSGIGEVGDPMYTLQAGKQHAVASDPLVVAETVRSHPRAGSYNVGNITVTHTLRGEGFDASEDGTGRGTPLVVEDYAPTLNFNRDGAPIVFDTTQITSAADRSRPKPGDPSHPLAAGAHPPAIAFHGSQDPNVSGDVTHPVGRNNGLETCAQTGMAVRRLTPREAERLQGFPDGYTRIAWRGKDPEDCPDGHRYRALGNSMAVNVMSWLGQRIAAVDAVSEDTS